MGKLVEANLHVPSKMFKEILLYLTDSSFEESMFGNNQRNGKV